MTNCCCCCCCSCINRNARHLPRCQSHWHRPTDGHVPLSMDADCMHICCWTALRWLYRGFVQYCSAGRSSYAPRLLTWTSRKATPTNSPFLYRTKVQHIDLAQHQYQHTNIPVQLWQAHNHAIRTVSIQLAANACVCLAGYAACSLLSALNFKDCAVQSPLNLMHSLNEQVQSSQLFSSPCAPTCNSQ